MDTRRIASLMLATLAGLPVAAFAAPPATERDDVKETLHGVELSDPYRWLEGDNSNPAQMGRMNDRVAAWTDGQNNYTRSVLDNLPGRKAVEDKMRPLLQIGSVSAPNMAGSRYFYSKREGSQAQARLFVRETSDGERRLLIDPVTLDASGLTTLSGVTPSQDGTLLAYGTFRAGDENTTTYVMNVATGEKLDVAIPGRSSVIQWMPDNSGFFYERLEDPKNPYSAQIRWHKLGTDHEKDPVLFRQYTKEENEKLATTWGPGATVSRDGKWMILMYWTGTSSNDIWAINLDHWRKTGEFKKAVIKTDAPNTFFGAIEGDTFYMHTDYGAPNKRLIAVDLNNPSESNWKEIIPENKNAVLSSFSVAKGIIVGEYEEKASTKMRLFGMDGGSKGELRLPGIGSAGISTEHDRTEAYLTFTSFNYPNTIFRVDLAKPDAEPTVWERPAVPVDPSIVEVNQVTYSSKDGTPVTMFVVHKKGLKLDGNNPVILNGYGGFNISETPFFSATLFPWFEAGGVFALPNLRGGGEYGKQWHEAGMLGNKQNVFDDMIAAAEWLVKNNYTQPSRLATIGGSNGGLLMGAMMTQRPDLFGAIICQVPLLDMLRYQEFLMARYWVPEYGDPANPEHFAFIKKYSPYHNVKAGTKFPGILFTAGENDARTHPMHARKMAAKVRDANTGDRPVLLWVDRDAGHGGGKPLELRLRDAVDTRMFIMWQLGMLDGLAPNQLPQAATSQAEPAPQFTITRVVSLNVAGMTCEMCVDTVTQTLKGVKGVKNVNVSLEKNAADVELENDSDLDGVTLAKALEGTKFKATPK